MVQPRNHRSPSSWSIATPGRRVWALTALAWLAVLATAAVPVAAQDAARHGIFIDTIDVNLVNIEVMVYDREGNPVTGLTRDDFQVLVDGQPVEITNFFAIEDGERVGRNAAVPAGEAADRASESAPVEGAEYTPMPLPEDDRYVILFIDNANIDVRNRKRVFEDLRDHLDRLMEPADRVMVVTLDNQLSIRQPFTTDPELVRSTIAEVETERAGATMREMEARRILGEIYQADAPAGSDFASTGGQLGNDEGNPFEQRTDDIDARRTLGTITSYAQSVQAQSLRTIQILSQFIGSLAGLPGRKAVLYVSDGLELIPGEFLFRVWDSKYADIAAADAGIPNIDAEIDRYRLDHPFQELIGEANSNRVAFYTIQGGQNQDFAGVSAENTRLVTDTLARGADSAREESLRALAYETGGVPLLGGGGVEGLIQQLETDFNHYYSLGFPSPHEGDGEYHRVEVLVDREDVRARYLEGYQDKGSDDRMTDQTLASLLHDVGNNPLEVEVEIGKQSRVQGGKGFLVPVMVKIPMSKLVLIPQDQAHLGRLSIFIAVRDDSGRLAPPQKIDVPVRIPNEQLLSAMGQMAGYAAEIQMRPGRQKLAVGVRDELAAVDSTLNLNLQVGGS